ncbi:nucleosome-remodeling factor subunit BPTF-like [Diadema antillarum]|uniref:nucleosome-remodeling factor subunit BPTF-like n=1 Tax=Diadema antillarum TaxID=105358 RepID=UPI003A8A6543
MRRGRGRRPKSLVDSQDESPTNAKKSVGGVGRGRGGHSNNSSPASSRCSTPVSLASSTGASGRGRSPRLREAARRSQRLIQEVIAAQHTPAKSSPVTIGRGRGSGRPRGRPPQSKSKPKPKVGKGRGKKGRPKYESSDDEDEKDYDDELLVSSSSEESSNESSDSNSLGDVDDLDEDSDSDGSSAAKRRLLLSRPSRSLALPFLEYEEIPSLELPPSSTDLMLDTEDILEALSVYEVLRHFSHQLRLSPFRFEDFCAALCSEEQCTLLSETHQALLYTLIKEEESSGTTFGPHDQRDSVNVQILFLDSMTWPEVVRAYVESDKEFRSALGALEGENYPFSPVSDKLTVLRLLCDQFLASNRVREEILSEGAITYDDHCRSCHKLGDLICCETCSAVYHLECVDLVEVPEDDWLCTVCQQHRVAGVYDCISEVEKSGLLIRQEPLGYDRHGRKYWHLCRRLFVEGENEVWYYSTKPQLEELLHALDAKKWEVDLFQALTDSMPDLLDQMQRTEELTNSARGNQKSVLQKTAEELSIVKAKREEALLREQEEKRRLEEEAAMAKAQEEAGVKEAETGEEKMEVDGAGDTATGNQEAKEAESQEMDSSAVQDAKEADSSEKSEEKEEKLDGDGEQKPNGDQSSPAEDSGDHSKEQDLEKKEDGESEGKEGESKGARVMTRSRNPNYKPPPPKATPYLTYTTSIPTRTTSTVASSRSKGDDMLVINSKGEINRVGKGEDRSIITRSTLRPESLFKLGMEGTYKSYKNQFTTNRLALNKPQHAEERDRKRYLVNKFTLTPAAEFKWHGSTHGNRILTISTLRLTITQLESNIPRSLMHTNWTVHRSNWIKAVHMCSKPHAFALALSVLECAVKPVVFNSYFAEGLGHIRMQRTSALEKEERKKGDRKKKDDDDEVQSNYSWVKYCFPIKHQVWKLKGEEYRIYGGSGFGWHSATRKRRPLPPPSPAKIGLERSIKAAKASGAWAKWGNPPATEEPRAPKEDGMEVDQDVPQTTGPVKEEAAKDSSMEVDADAGDKGAKRDDDKMDHDGQCSKTEAGSETQKSTDDETKVSSAADSDAKQDGAETKMDTEESTQDTQESVQKDPVLRDPGEQFDESGAKDDKNDDTVLPASGKTTEEAPSKEQTGVDVGKPMEPEQSTTEAAKNAASSTSGSGTSVKETKLAGSESQSEKVDPGQSPDETVQVVKASPTTNDVISTKEGENLKEGTDTPAESSKADGNDAESTREVTDVSEGDGKVLGEITPAKKLALELEDLDISNALRNHTVYRKIPYKSRLEGLLELRTKEHQQETIKFQSEIGKYAKQQKMVEEKEKLLAALKKKLAAGGDIKAVQGVVEGMKQQMEVRKSRKPQVYRQPSVQAGNAAKAEVTQKSVPVSSPATTLPSASKPTSVSALAAPVTATSVPTKSVSVKTEVPSPTPKVIAKQEPMEVGDVKEEVHNQPNQPKVCGPISNESQSSVQTTAKIETKAENESQKCSAAPMKLSEEKSAHPVTDEKRSSSDPERVNATNLATSPVSHTDSVEKLPPNMNVNQTLPGVSPLPTNDQPDEDKQQTELAQSEEVLQAAQEDGSQQSKSESRDAPTEISPKAADEQDVSKPSSDTSGSQTVEDLCKPVLDGTVETTLGKEMLKQPVDMEQERQPSPDSVQAQPDARTDPPVQDEGSSKLTNAEQQPPHANSKPPQDSFMAQKDSSSDLLTETATNDEAPTVPNVSKDTSFSPNVTINENQQHAPPDVSATEHPQDSSQCNLSNELQNESESSGAVSIVQKSPKEDMLDSSIAQKDDLENQEAFTSLDDQQSLCKVMDPCNPEQLRSKVEDNRVENCRQSEGSILLKQNPLVENHIDDLPVESTEVLPAAVSEMKPSKDFEAGSVEVERTIQSSPSSDLLGEKTPCTDNVADNHVMVSCALSASGNSSDKPVTNFADGDVGTNLSSSNNNSNVEVLEKVCDFSVMQTEGQTEIDTAGDVSSVQCAQVAKTNSESDAAVTPMEVEDAQLASQESSHGKSTCNDSALSTGEKLVNCHNDETEAMAVDEGLACVADEAKNEQQENVVAGELSQEVSSTPANSADLMKEEKLGNQGEVQSADNETKTVISDEKPDVDSSMHAVPEIPEAKVASEGSSGAIVGTTSSVAVIPDEKPEVDSSMHAVPEIPEAKVASEGSSGMVVGTASSVTVIPDEKPDVDLNMHAVSEIPEAKVASGELSGAMVGTASSVAEQDSRMDVDEGKSTDDEQQPVPEVKEEVTPTTDSKTESVRGVQDLDTTTIEQKPEISIETPSADLENQREEVSSTSQVTTEISESKETKVVEKVVEKAAVSEDAKEAKVAKTVAVAVVTEKSQTITTTVTKTTTTTTTTINRELRELIASNTTTTTTETIISKIDTSVTQTMIQAEIIKLESALKEEAAAIPKPRRTNDRVRLQKGPKTKRVIKRLAKPLPICYMFSTRSRKRSILVLPQHDLKRLSRRAGNLEVEGYSYNTKNVGDFWPYPCPRPSFKICWRYRLQTVKSLSAVSLLLRILWASVRWDDINIKPPNNNGVTVINTSSEKITTEIIDRRDVPPSGVKSQYLIRKTIVPKETAVSTPEVHKPQRSGLRSSATPSRREVKDKPRSTETIEVWVPEEELELWEVQQYCEKQLRQQARDKAKERESKALAAASSATTTPVTVTKVSSSHNKENEAAVKLSVSSSRDGKMAIPSLKPTKSVADQVRQELEEQLAKQRLQMQQKRLGVSGTAKVIVTLAKPSSAKTTISMSNVAALAGKGKGLPPGTTIQYISGPAGTQQARIIANPSQAQGQARFVITNTPGAQGQGTLKVIKQVPPTGVSPSTNPLLAPNTPGKVATIRQAGVQQVITSPSVSQLVQGVRAQTPTSTAATATSQAPVTQPQLTGQAQVFSNQAQVLQVGGQKFVITPAQVQVQGTGQMIPAQLIQTQTSQGAVLQRLVLTPNAAQGSTPGSIPQVNLQAAVQAVQQTQQNQKQQAAAAAAATTITSPTLVAPRVQQKLPQAQIAKIPIATQVQQQPQLTIKTQPLTAATPKPIRLAQTPGENLLLQQASTSLGTTNPMPARPGVQLAAAASTAGTSTPATFQGAKLIANLTAQQQVSLIKQQLELLQKSKQNQTTLATVQAHTKFTPDRLASKEFSQRLPKKPVVSQPKHTKEREEMQRNHACQVVMKSILDRIEKEERQSRKRKHQEMSRDQRRQQAESSKKRALLECHKAKLKDAILLKRNQLERRLKMDIYNEMRRERWAEKRKEKEALGLVKPKKQKAEEPVVTITAATIAAATTTSPAPVTVVSTTSKPVPTPALETTVTSTVTPVAITTSKPKKTSAATAARKKIAKAKARKKLTAKKKKTKVMSSEESQVSVPVIKEEPETETETGMVEAVRMEVGVESGQPVAKPAEGGETGDELYCICKTPYDASKFYIGCDVCLNWFHGSCVKVTEKMAAALKEYVCDACKQVKQETDEELYCLCRQPYDESQFYIGCDRCNDWFHGRCVGISQEEAESIENYICPKCKSTSLQGLAKQKTLTSKDYDHLKKMLRQLQSHKMAWPFIEPVSELDAPDYYDVIKEPMDLSTVEDRLKNKHYVKLSDFAADIGKIFDNCRYYNPTDTPYYQCADVLEKFFIQKMKSLK